MVSIPGKYQLERNENLTEYLVQLGFPESAARKANEIKPLLEVHVEGDRYTLKSNSGMQNSSISFALNEKYEERMPNGKVLQSIAVLEGDNIVVTSLTDDGRKGERVYEFSNDGLVLRLTSSISQIVAHRFYRRL